MLDSVLAAILSIFKRDKLHPIAFHSRSFQLAEQNYDVYDKELLAIFKAFKKWRHYLEDTLLLVEVIIDHYNLEYFFKSKTLTHRQAHWSKFLSQFNLKILFGPGRLGTKPDALIQRWDVYSKENPDSGKIIDLQNTLLLFSPNQLSPALRAVYLHHPDLLQDSLLDLSALI